MTRTGIVRQYYGRIELRPFSRFASSQKEIEANKKWLEQADKWGELNINKYGYLVNNKKYQNNLKSNKECTYEIP